MKLKNADRQKWHTDRETDGTCRPPEGWRRFGPDWSELESEWGSEWDGTVQQGGNQAESETAWEQTARQTDRWDRLTESQVRQVRHYDQVCYRGPSSRKVFTRPAASTSNRRGGGMSRGRGEGGGRLQLKPCRPIGSVRSRSRMLIGSWCVGEGGPLRKMSPAPSLPLIGWASRWAASCEWTPPLSLSRPIISRDSSEWACLMVSSTRLNPAPSCRSTNSEHVHRPRRYGSPRPPPPAPLAGSFTTLNLEEQLVPGPRASWETYFLFTEGVVGWEELPCEEEAADWTADRSSLDVDWPTGVWLKSEVTLVIWKPLLFLPPLILTHTHTHTHTHTQQAH